MRAVAFVMSVHPDTFENNAMKDWLVEHRRALHAHPELGFQEFWTSDYLAAVLESLGIEVTRGIAKTGLVGLIRGQNPELPALGYRADMDALPIVEDCDFDFSSKNGCMHACGHDSHMTVALGLAKRLAERGERPLRNIAIVFQPNEEGAPGELPGGAELMCEEGVLERFNISQMLALHSDPRLNVGQMGVCRGCLWAASGRFAIKVLGEAAHAAYPEKGRDALWAAAEMISAIYAAKSRQRKVAPEVISICQLQAGTSFNVVAARASFDGIVRAPSKKDLGELLDLIEATASGIAAACNVGLVFERFYGADEVINDNTLTDIARNVWSNTGHGLEVQMNMAAEDFSSFSKRVPSFFAMMGIKPTDVEEIPPSHASNFWLDEDSLEPAVEAMLSLIDAIMSSES